MMQLTDVSFARGAKPLLINANLTVHAKQKLAMVGRNGAGKSSVFALLLGQLTCDTGEVSVPRHWQIAHLEQEVPALPQSALDYVLDGDQEWRTIEQALTTATQAEDIAALHERMSQIDGYSAKARAAQLLHGLGFQEREHQQPVHAFSGGWRMRLNLAKTLMKRADLLLLDEPTNHLDLDAIVWLEQWLQHYPGTLLFISHDRDFIDAVATHIVHVDQQSLTLYTGHYSDFERQRAAKLALQQSLYDKQQRQRAHLQKFIDRFKAKASKAAQAQSRIKALERMAIIEAAQVDNPFEFHFKEAVPCSNPLLSLNQLTLAYADKTILRGVTATINLDARIGLIGPNGAGKSTLIQALVQHLQPREGQCTVNPAVRIGYFAQHQVESLDHQASPLQHLQRLSPMSAEQSLRTYLGGFGFIGDQALMPVAPLSGGEKTRLALALLIWQRPNLLLLDEPTNHLDLEMRHALTRALQQYQGALVVVSHDRHLLRATTDHLWLVANQQVSDFAGDLDAYQHWLKEYRRQQIPVTTPVKASAASPVRRVTKNPYKIAKIETELAQQQKLKADIDLALNDPEVYQVHQQARLQALLHQQAETLARIEALESEWLNLNLD